MLEVTGNLSPTPVVSESYDASKLGKLEGLEAVRKKPGMYIGGTDERALHHCVTEVLDNSVDEYLAGFCGKIDVTVHIDGSISIRDNGRGIPVDMHPKWIMPAVESMLTNLHAGGKFGQGAYKYSGGLHGVGAKCVNALSDWFKVALVEPPLQVFEGLDVKDPSMRVANMARLVNAYRSKLYAALEAFRRQGKADSPEAQLVERIWTHLTHVVAHFAGDY